YMTWLYEDTPYSESSASVLKFMGTVECQRSMVELSRGFLVSTFEEANTSADPSLLHPKAKQVSDLAADLMRACPQFEIRNPDAGAVMLRLKAADPGISATIEGILTGQLKDAEAALSDLDGRLDEAMEKAFEEAQAQGASVDISELQFPNWDPAEDYTADDYAALGE